MIKRAVCNLLVLLLLAAGMPACGDELLVGAASSLTEAMREIGAAFAKEAGHTSVRFTFASSGSLERQVEQGAPIDVFASAAPEEMDALAKSNHIEPKTRLNFASNRLVLIVRQGSPVRTWSDLAKASVAHVAISDPRSVPSGRYAKETLTRRNLWTAVEPKAVFGQNVRQSLAYVSGGDADAGIVFATDAQIEPGRVRVVATAKSGADHEPILYPAAVVAGSSNPIAARRFVQFLRSRAARGILARHGFPPVH